MTHTRFRLRAVMIVIAALALLMGLLMAQFRLIARTDAYVLFAVELPAIIVFVVPLLLQFFVLAAYFWRRQTPRRKSSMTDNPPAPETGTGPNR
jgi:hypothetical protein